MAVETEQGGSDFSGRQLRYGTNVAVAVALVIAICAVLQWAGYRFGGKADWTTSSVNSLSEGSENLLAGLDQNVRITSAYFETDLEADDQKKFRQAVRDLADLYQIENRSKIEVNEFNPLKDHDKRKQLMERLAGKAKFAEQSSKHRELVEAFNDEILPQIGVLLSSELEMLSADSEGLGGQGDYVVQQVQVLFQRRQQEANAVSQDIQASLGDDIPRYSAAITVMRSFYTSTTKLLKDVGATGQQVMGAGNAGLSPAQKEFLGGAKERYQTVLDALAAQITRMTDLPQLELEKIVRELGPGSNTLVVETQDDARVLSFADVWPAMDPSMGAASTAFKDRAFKGEQKLSSAILQLTSDETTAVVIAKFGGPPLFFGGFMPGQPPAPYARLKTHLEDLNFEVYEWDLASQKEPPEMDPPPARTIYVVLKPQSPPMNMMQRQQQPTFGPLEREAVITALGQSGRALFLAGWYPGPMGPMPGTYEYSQYLQDEWGIKVEAGVLLLQARPVGPGTFRLTRTSTLMLAPVFSDHPVVSSLGTIRSVFPYVAPLTLPADAPEGVTISELVRCDWAEGLWGAHSVQKYVEQTSNEHQMKVEGDTEGPFILAVAASKEGAKVAVVSGRDVFVDDMAFAVEAVLSAQGLQLRSRNPGNLTLLSNCMHWLNDNEEIMNLGRPLDVPTLEIAEGPELSFLRFLVWGIWPTMAGLCGGAVWYARRR